ncbi:hypothetical protein EOD42_22570 [Rhodovarius crocodyli]|uniref:MarR family transcriptional regulator n=1 Tax=Rhodovarius crocodyli TaxID=1979269 RepID=A0A437M1N2_9PROT|nr:hypothetical protein [Rhodovarius crocodyli]RVT91443.1 hypothetical protein EOD42_22570 [Rhodovarius crocodyli]
MASAASAPLSALTHAFVAASAVDEVFTCRQVALLGLLVETGGHSVAHYADAMSVSKAVVTRASYKLVALGLGNCSKANSDRRLVVLTATGEGRAMWKRLGGLLHQAGGLAMASEMLAFARSGAGFAYPAGALQKLARLVETKGASWE